METEQVAVSAKPADVDLTGCAQESVHLPGSILPHGMLPAVMPVDFRLMPCGANAGAAAAFGFFATGMEQAFAGAEG